MRGMATVPIGNQELAVRDKVERPYASLGLGLSKSSKCDIFPSVL